MSYAFLTLQYGEGVQLNFFGVFLIGSFRFSSVFVLGNFMTAIQFHWNDVNTDFQAVMIFIPNFNRLAFLFVARKCQSQICSQRIVCLRSVRRQVISISRATRPAQQTSSCYIETWWDFYNVSNHANEAKNCWGLGNMVRVLPNNL